MTGVHAIPTSAQQRTFWRWHHAHAAGTTYNIAALYSLDGHLDIATFRRALTDVLARSPTLRASFLGGADGTLHMVCLTDLGPVDVAEFNGTDEEVTAAVTAPFDLDAPPLLRARLADRGPAGVDLLLASHHLVVDGTALNQILRDCLAAVNGLPVGAREGHEAYVGRQVLGAWRDQAAIAAWTRRFATQATSPLRIPKPGPAVEAAPNVEILTVTLPDDLMSGLQTLTRSHRVSPFMSVLTAFAVAAGNRLDLSRVRIGVPVDCRDRPDVSLGTYTLVVPVTIDLAMGDRARTLESLRSTILDLIDIVGAAPASAPEIIDRLAEDEPAWHVIVNSIQFDGSPTIGAHRVRSVTPLSAGAKVDLSLNLVVDPTSARLITTYAPARVDPAQVRALIEQTGAELGELLAECGASPVRSTTAALDHELTRELWDAVWSSPRDGDHVILREGSHRFESAEIDAYRRRVVDLVSPFLGDGAASILEIGCGAGQIVTALAGTYGCYVATDPSPVAARIVGDLAAEHGWPVAAHMAFAHEAVEEFPGPFDVILLAGVIQFFPDRAYLRDVLARAVARLQPGGAVVIADVVPTGSRQFQGATLKLAPDDVDEITAGYAGTEILTRPASIGSALSERYDVVLRPIAARAGRTVAKRTLVPAGATGAPAADPDGRGDIDLATVIGRAFSTVLGRDIGPDDDFFGNGGSSLSLAAAVAAIRNDWGFPVRVRDFLTDEATPAALARRVQRAIRVRELR